MASAFQEYKTKKEDKIHVPVDYNNTCGSCVSGCGRKRCMTCPALNSDNSFTSSVSGKTFKVLGTQAISCNTTTVVYLIRVRGVVFSMYMYM